MLKTLGSVLMLACLCSRGEVVLRALLGEPLQPFSWLFTIFDSFEWNFKHCPQIVKDHSATQALLLPDDGSARTMNGIGAPLQITLSLMMDGL